MLQQLIIDNIDLWTSAETKRSTTGRGSNKKIELTGIKKLHELILELAVRGLLVPQDPNDEPASVLLEKVTTEKNKLIKDGKIKKSKSLLSISADEKMFDLPDRWEWCRIGNLVHLEMGQSPPSKFYNQTGDGMPFFQGKADFGDLYPTARYWCVKPQKISYPGDVLLSVRAPVGPTNITNMKCCIGRGLAALRPLANMPTGYIHTLMKRNHRMLEALGTGTTFVAISKTGIENFCIPIAPLAEQHRIVAKVDELMALCDQLEQQQSQHSDTHHMIVTTLLDSLSQATDNTRFQAIWSQLLANFDTLFTNEASIDQLKQTILQLAVMGKLVPQDPNDEPASMLLEKLILDRNKWLSENKERNKECATMLRKLSKLSPPQSPFKIPSNWVATQLITTTRFLIDCHNKTAPYTEDGVPIIRTSNIRDTKFRLLGMKYVSQDTYDYWSRRCPPKSGDIIFTREAPMGEAAIIPENTQYCLGQRTMLVRPMHEYISNEYLLLTLTEPHLLERASVHAVGATVKHLRVGDVENLTIPIPPLAEQYRIIAKVDELLSLCEQLKDRLNQAQTTQQHLAHAIVEQAVG